MEENKTFSNNQDLAPSPLERNELYPVFLKLHNLKVLIVGGGNVGLEKLSFLLICMVSDSKFTILDSKFTVLSYFIDDFRQLKQ